MTRSSIFSIVAFGILGIYPCILPATAQTPTGTAKNNAPSFEDDRIKVVVRECARQTQILTCQAILTSKNGDRTIELNGNAIKLVDFEGNEYYPISVRLANKTSEVNYIKTELIENIPTKATLNFGRVAGNFTQIALLQIPLPLEGTVATAKFRNFTIASAGNNSTQLAVKSPKSNPNSAAPVTIAPEVSSDNSSICPDNAKILYRATSKSYLIYICGTKNPTHYVGQAKDGSQGITLRLRYYDRAQFSADNGDTNYTIAADRLIIRKNNKIIYQEKIQVLQALTIPIVVEDTSKSKPKKTAPPASNNSERKRNSTSQSSTTTKQ